jgi:hypothetical protein
MRVRTIGAGLLAVGFAGTSLLGAGVASAGGTRGAATASSARTLYLTDCHGDRAKIKPKFVVLACADAGAVVEKANWTHWGDAKATATAALTENDCTPTCFQGTFVSEPVKVTVSSIKKRNGTYEYTHIRVVPDSPNRHRFKTYSGSLPA